MRCMACGTEMILIKVVPDRSVMVPGFERHVLQCVSCGDAEERLSFSRERARAAEKMIVPEAPPLAPAPRPVASTSSTPTPTSVNPAAPGAFDSVAARLRGRPKE